MKRIEAILKELARRYETLSTAESCTGGGLAHEISQVPGVSPIFFGGIIAYANEAKENLLNIPHDTIAKYGAVSQEVALLMARNCQEAFSSTWALSTTGISGPTGGSVEKPVGLVWIGIAGPKVVSAQQFIFSNVSRLEHRNKTIEQALLMLKKSLA
jgi:nicotinamide-nucleotide amidase